MEYYSFGVQQIRSTTLLQIRSTIGERSSKNAPFQRGAFHIIRERSVINIGADRLQILTGFLGECVKSDAFNCVSEFQKPTQIIWYFELRKVKVF